MEENKIIDDKKQKKKKIWIIVGVVVLILGILTISMMMLFKKEETTLYTITFDTNGGDHIESIKVKEGEVLDLPKEEPAKEGYVFSGWLLEEKELGKDYKATKDITLKANWRQLVSKNRNILEAYTYNSDLCKTGEEPTCTKLTTLPTTVEAGTIIKYKVNDQEEKYFYVMFDEGNTLTLQQRENTVNQVAWYKDEADNRKGPLTALASLEEATKNWTNVKDQTYALGTTTFKINAATGCEAKNNITYCTNNAYTLPERTAKARMIMLQEVMILSNDSTLSDLRPGPEWLYNSTLSNSYLKPSDGTDYGYWTATVLSGIWSGHYGDIYTFEEINDTAENISNFGITQCSTSEHRMNGARAVIVIDK